MNVALFRHYVEYSHLCWCLQGLICMAVILFFISVTAWIMFREILIFVSCLPWLRWENRFRLQAWKAVRNFSLDIGDFRRRTRWFLSASTEKKFRFVNTLLFRDMEIQRCVLIAHSTYFSNNKVSTVPLRSIHPPCGKKQWYRKGVGYPRIWIWQMRMLQLQSNSKFRCACCIHESDLRIGPEKLIIMKF